MYINIVHCGTLFLTGYVVLDQGFCNPGINKQDINGMGLDLLNLHTDLLELDLADTPKVVACCNPEQCILHRATICPTPQRTDLVRTFQSGLGDCWDEGLGLGLDNI